MLLFSSACPTPRRWTLACTHLLRNNRTQCLEQSNLLQRLGPWRLYTPGHASCHWVLDLSNPGHEEVARKLVGLAVAGGELPNFWNIRLRGELAVLWQQQQRWLHDNTAVPRYRQCAAAASSRMPFVQLCCAA